MSNSPARVAVVGAGAFGTCLAAVLGLKGERVLLWGRNAEAMAALAETRSHPSREGITIPAAVEPTADLAAALACPLLINAVPAQQTRAFWGPLRDRLHPDVGLLLASKGIEQGTGLRLDEVYAELFGVDWVRGRLAALSGPTFARELARGVPSAAVVAAADERLAVTFQTALAAPFFRLYAAGDLIGVEVAGAVKNVIAIAAGLSDGLGLGLNTRAAIVTRGLAEMTRFGVAQGADPATFSGLAGVGDLLLTATGDLSRNRTVGKRLGAGESVADVLGGMQEVAEGVTTTRSTLERAVALGVEMPIAEQVGEILFNGKDPSRAVFDLMTRTLKRESPPS